MLLFLTLVSAATRSLINQIAIEYKRNPIARSASNGYDVSEMKSYKEPAFFLSEGSVVLGQISPNSIYNLHSFMEGTEGISTCPSIKTVGKESAFNSNSLSIPNLESPVSRASLSSLYVRALFKKYHNVTDGVAITVSGRDYYTQEQVNALARVFSTLGHRVRVIPESLAACTQLAAMVEKERSYGFLNLRGSQGVLTAYKVKKDDKKTTITRTHQSNVSAMPDEALEKLAASHVISQLRDKGADGVDFLPYENSEGREHYVDIQRVVDRFIEAVGQNLGELKILQVDIRSKKDDSVVGGLIEKTIDVDGFRKTIDLAIPELPDLEEGTVMVLLSRIGRPGPYPRETRELILDGLVASQSSSIVFEDDRVADRVIDVPYEMMGIDKELELRRTAQDLARNFSEVRKTLVHVLDSEVEPLEVMLGEDLSKVSNLFKVEKAYEELRMLSNRRIANAVLKEGYIKGLESSLADAKEVVKEKGVEEGLRDGLVSYCDETEKWLEKNKERDDALGEIQRRTFMVGAHVKLIRDKLRKEEKPKEEPANEKSANEDLVNEDLANEKSANKDLPNEKSANEDLANEDLLNETPANEDLANKDLANEEPESEKPDYLAEDDLKDKLL